MPHTALLPKSKRPKISGPSRSIWLDLLPAEIRVRIATLVSSRTQCEDALHLAETTPLQADAVVSALDYSVEIDHTIESDRWTSIFRPAVRRVYFSPWIMSLDPSKPGPLSLLVRPTLRCAIINSHSVVLSTIRFSKSLRRLRIYTDQRCDVPLLIDTLGALNLNELQLWCTEKIPSLCPIMLLARNELRKATLSSKCNSITALRIHCPHREPIWNLMPCFRGLNRLIIESNHVPETLYPTLLGLKDVHIMGIRNAYDLAIKLKSVVTKLQTSQLLDAEMFEQLLEVCPRLTSLEIGAVEGIEHGIKRVARSLEGLRILKLRWEEPTEWHPREHRYNVAQFATVTPGLIAESLKFMVDLESIDLLSVRVGMDEVERVLSSCGRRLKHFGFSFADQDETPFDRLLGILDIVRRCNPEIRSLELDMLRTEDMVLLGMMQTNSSREREQLEATLDRAFKSLARTAIMLDLQELQDSIGWYFL